MRCGNSRAALSWLWRGSSQTRAGWHRLWHTGIRGYSSSGLHQLWDLCIILQFVMQTWPSSPVWLGSFKSSKNAADYRNVFSSQKLGAPFIRQVSTEALWQELCCVFQDALSYSRLSYPRVAQFLPLLGAVARPIRFREDLEGFIEEVGMILLEDWGNLFRL